MKVRERMTAAPIVCGADESLETVARRLSESELRAMPVVDERGVFAGMVTDRDLVLRVIAMCRDPVQAKVSEAMTPGLVFCYDDEEAEVAAELMAEKQIRRLPIISRRKRLVGMVSLGDLVVDGLDAQTAGAVLHDVSDPSQSSR